MTKKYTAASSKIVRRMPGRPPVSDNPFPKLMNTTAEKAITSNNGAYVEREISEDVGDHLPKNRDSDTYAISKRWDLVDPHRR